MDIEKWGFIMRTDLRVKHDIELRIAAMRLLDAGRGDRCIARALSVPRETVREWQQIYRTFGSEVLLSMDGKQTRYTYEQRVAAASAVVDGGMARPDAMREFGIMSPSPLSRWCRLYREGGAEALRVFATIKLDTSLSRVVFDTVFIARMSKTIFHR